MIKRIALSLSGLIVVALGGAALYLGTACPCDRTPGVALWGEVQTETVEDWSFVNETGLCQLQVDNGILPHAINLNCMSANGELFLSCSQCEGKYWSTVALGNPKGRIRIDGLVYPVTLSRVKIAGELDRAWSARPDKLHGVGHEVDDQRPDHWWSFRVRSG